MQEKPKDLQQYLVENKSSQGVLVGEMLAGLGIDFYVVHSMASQIVGGASPEKLEKLEGFKNATQEYPKTDIDVMIPYYYGCTDNESAIYPIDDNHNIAIIEGSLIVSSEYHDSLPYDGYDREVELINQAMSCQLSRVPYIDDPRNHFKTVTRANDEPMILVGQNVANTSSTEPFSHHKSGFVAEIALAPRGDMPSDISWFIYRGYLPPNDIFKVTNAQGQLLLEPQIIRWEDVANAFTIESYYSAFQPPVEWTTLASIGLKALRNTFLKANTSDLPKLIEVLSERNQEQINQYFAGQTHHDGLLNYSSRLSTEESVRIRKRALNMLNLFADIISIDSKQGLLALTQAGYCDLLFGNYATIKEGSWPNYIQQYPERVVDTINNLIGSSTSVPGLQSRAEKMINKINIAFGQTS